MRTPEADDDTQIKDLDDLLFIYGDDWHSCKTIKHAQQRFAKGVYDHTSCGAWARLVMADTDYSVIGIEVGSIVEGTRESVPGKTIFFPFTLGTWRDLISAIEQHADYLWHEANDR